MSAPNKNFDPVLPAALDPVNLQANVDAALTAIGGAQDLAALKQVRIDHTGDRSLLLWTALQAGQTNSYDQAAAAFEDLMAMVGNEASDAHYQYAPGQEMLLAKVKK